jgi:biotin-(acetyl-CoA carboxylase) ligase
MGIAYMNEDMANFRLVAFGSLAMSMVAQHKLKQSFLFRWNALFLGINMAWILKSHLHVQEEIMTEDIQEAYNLLQEQGNFLSQNQARELFLRGQKQTWKRGDFLTSEGFPCKEL